MNWLLAGSLLLALCVGGGIGLMVGHSRGSSSRGPEIDALRAKLDRALRESDASLAEERKKRSRTEREFANLVAANEEKMRQAEERRAEQEKAAADLAERLKVVQANAAAKKSDPEPDVRPTTPVSTPDTTSQTLHKSVRALIERSHTKLSWKAKSTWDQNAATFGMPKGYFDAWLAAAGYCDPTTATSGTVIPVAIPSAKPTLNELAKIGVLYSSAENVLAWLHFDPTLEQYLTPSRATSANQVEFLLLGLEHAITILRFSRDQHQGRALFEGLPYRCDPRCLPLLERKYDEFRRQYKVNP